MRTELVIHLLPGKWTQALKQFCGRRVSKCDHFVTCQEERELALPGGKREWACLMGPSLAIHFSSGKKGVGKEESDCHHRGVVILPRKKRLQPARQDCSRETGRRRVGVSAKRGARPVPPMGAQSGDLCLH